MQYIIGLKGPYALNPKGICGLILREGGCKSFKAINKGGQKRINVRHKILRIDYTSQFLL